MRTLLVLVSALAVAGWSSPARADVDCEAARCAVQDAIARQCPCAEATTHGGHVRCVAHVVTQLAADGAIPARCKGQIKRCAARSTCGRKAGTVVCERAGGARCSISPSAARCVARGGTVAARTSCCRACATPCGSESSCDAAREVCVGHGPVGPAVLYACEPVPAGCESDRSCDCVAASLCQGAFDTCHDVAENAVFCECPACQ